MAWADWEVRISNGDFKSCRSAERDHIIFIGLVLIGISNILIFLPQKSITQYKKYALIFSELTFPELRALYYLYYYRLVATVEKK